jgi:hypothetical protein
MQVNPQLMLKADSTMSRKANGLVPSRLPRKTSKLQIFGPALAGFAGGKSEHHTAACRVKYAGNPDESRD